MARDNFKYELSKIADNDLEEIFDFTIWKFGFEQGVSYLQLIEEVIVLLAQQPNMGKQRNELKEGLLSYPVESHIIFYQILPNRIRIVRILHGSRDLPRFFLK
ncbi:MAG: type II toxin-antitoxin system RelE/ParE family toxin [Chitinophagales bacterium]|nr:type II toxin-antitoxin system RelE/ParE family toxin [Chitinophagales bacterium]